MGGSERRDAWACPSPRRGIKPRGPWLPRSARPLLAGELLGPLPPSTVPGSGSTSSNFPLHWLFLSPLPGHNSPAALSTSQQVQLSNRQLGIIIYPFRVSRSPQETDVSFQNVTFSASCITWRQVATQASATRPRLLPPPVPDAPTILPSPTWTDQLP